MLSERMTEWRRAMAAAQNPDNAFEIFCRAATDIGTITLDVQADGDQLWNLATAYGLVDSRGSDEIEHVIADAFEAGAEAERVPDAKPPLEEPPQRAYTKVNGRGQIVPLALRDPFPINEAEIPTRDWIIPGLFMRRHVSVIVAPSGSGKSLLTLQLGIACTLNLTWAGWRPRGEFRVLVINSEDDFDEVRRRLAAAVYSMELDQAKLTGRFFVGDSQGGYVVARFDARSKTLLKTPMLESISQTIAAEKIDLVFVDPFAETFEGDENSNSELKWAGMMWREVARQANAAVCLIHHTKKYASGMAGDVDAARGAGALIGIARVVSTLFPMTTKEAEVMEISEEERVHFLRFDDAKANLNLKSGIARWFRKNTVTLNNSTQNLPGDQVGALVPWKPDDAFENVTAEAIDSLLAAIDRGIPDERGKEFYTFSSRQRDGDEFNRWAGLLVCRMLGVEEARATKMLEIWKKKQKVLVEFKYKSPRTRKWLKGCGSEMLRTEVEESLKPRLV
jgi:AAA domain-containing protein